jgi:hypothetical protein
MAQRVFSSPRYFDERESRTFVKSTAPWLKSKKALKREAENIDYNRPRRARAPVTKDVKSKVK